MIKIAHTTYPTNQPTEQEWLAEFRVGIMAFKRDNRAQEIMDSWAVDNRSIDWKRFIKKKLVDWNK